MGTDTNFSKSGSSPGSVGNGFAFSGGSPGVGSFMSHSGSSPTSSRVRPTSRVVLTQSFHSENFLAVNPLALVCLKAAIYG
jgi:hypothetical protein